MDKVRLAVLGVGSWTAVNHLPAIEGRDDVEWVAAVDTDPERRRNVAARFGFGLVTESVDEALGAGVDAVIVGSTPNAHHALTRAALESGAHVLCEKPFTTSAHEAWELVRLAEQRGRHLLTAFGWNYTPMVRRAEALLTANPIGTIEHLQIHMATALREMYLKIMPVWGSPRSSCRSLELHEPRAGRGLQPGPALACVRPCPVAHAAPRASGSSRSCRPSARRWICTTPSRSSSRTARPGPSRAPRAAWGRTTTGTSWTSGRFGSEGQLLLDFDREMIWLYRDPVTDFRLVVPDGAGAYECTGPANTLLDLALGQDVENRSPGWLAAQATEMTAAGYGSWRSGRAEDIDTSL